MKCWLGVTALIGLLAVGAARADIVGWQDVRGTTHFTNRRDRVPDKQQARVVISEQVQSTDSGTTAPVIPEPPRQAQVVYDYSHIADAYIEGLEQGLALARSGGGADFRITGPLAIATALGAQGPTYVPRVPFVTSSFDRGRSRHLTLRMLLQDQFQLDRDGPFIHERFPVGQGVALRPFLPRGLPHRLPQGRRVLLR